MHPRCALAVCCFLLLAGCEVGTEPTDQTAQPPPELAPKAGATIRQEPAPVDVIPSTVSKPQADVLPPARSATPAPAPQVAKGNLQFVEGYQRGYELAMQSGRPMLVFFTAEWCHYCHQMAGEAFMDPQVVNLARNFVCILVDADGEPAVCRQFRVQGYPTVQFISPRGVPLNRLVGKKPSGQVSMAMQAALQNIAARNEAVNR